MNIAIWLQRTALANPATSALFEGKRLVANYRELAGMVAAIAGGLHVDYGVRPGDRVGLFMSNNAEYLAALFAIWWVGGVAVPINAKLHENEAAWILTNAGAKAVFVSERDKGMAAGARGTGGLDFDRIAVESAQYRELLASSPLAGPLERSDADLAWLFYTSGTTGRPKGVMLSHGNLVAMTQAFIVDVDVPVPGEAYYYAAPMSHGAGLYCLVHTLKGNAHVVPAGKGFDPGVTLELAEHFGNLSLFAVPTMVNRLADHARSSGSTGEGLRTIIYGGAPMYVADIEAALDIFGSRFVQIYGQGETPMTITTLSRQRVAERDSARLASVGCAYSNTEVRISGPDGNSLPAGEVGEILVRGPAVMQGYWNNAEASAAALSGGWLWTGDVGVLSDDGYLTLKDRSKDVIISGGTNIYPREVEEALLTHPSVAEVCVIGRPHPEWGEEVMAFVVANEDHAVDEDALDHHCLTQIARFKRPKHYRFIAALPKSDYGKILKTALRQLVSEELERPHV